MELSGCGRRVSPAASALAFMVANLLLTFSDAIGVRGQLIRGEPASLLTARAAELRHAQLVAVLRNAADILFAKDLPQLIGNPPTQTSSSVAGGQAQATVHEKVHQMELDEFTASLSEDCARHFKNAFLGNGPALHTFGASGAVEDDRRGCELLNGSLCHTKADISQEGSSLGRTLSQEIHGESDGCLPRQCIQQHDLERMAKFMRVHAKAHMPPEDVRLQLSVDCRQAGGGNVTTGDSTELTLVSHAPEAGFTLTSASFGQ